MCESSRSRYPRLLVLIPGAVIPAFLAWKKVHPRPEASGLGRGRMGAGVYPPPVSSKQYKS